MIMANANVMGCGEALESLFCSDGGGSSHLRHQMDVSKVRVMIDEDGSTNIAFLGGKATVDWNEARCWTYKLVNADHGTRRCTLPNFLFILDTLEAGLTFLGFAVGTARTGGCINGSKVLRDYAAASHKLDSGKAEMSQCLVQG